MAPTGADGRTFVGSLDSGTYLLSAAAPGYGTVSQQVKLSPGYPLMVEIRLESLAGSLEGRVTDATSGTVLAGATVSLAQRSAVTDAEGRYRFEGIPPGVYSLLVSMGGYLIHERPATIEPRGSHTANVTLSPVLGLVRVQVVDANTGLPIEGATIGYRSIAEAPVQAEQPCADSALLVPLKRSREYRAVRARVSDPRPSDTWQEDGLHFFVFTLTSDGVGDDTQSPAEPPVAVFVMQPGAQEPVSAVVVRPRPDGQEAEVTSLGEADASPSPES